MSARGSSGEPSAGGARAHPRRAVLGWAGALVGAGAAALVGAPAQPTAVPPVAPAVARSAPAAVARPAAGAATSVRAVLGRRTHRNAVALTIDDGPHPTWTPQVLDVLAEHGVRATFSVVGRQARAYPRLVRRVVRGGHALCNHSMSHPQPFGARGTAAVRRQIVDAQDAIADAAGEEPTLFRAPGGDWTADVLAVCADLGLTPVGWSVDPRDWSRPGAAAIAAELLTAGPDDVLLCHDGGGDRAQTVAALAAVLPQLRRRGLRFAVL